MKQTKKIIIVVVLAIIIGSISIFCVKNRKKVSITAEEFKSIMEGKEYTIIEATNQFEKYDFVKKVYIATDGNYKIEFYELSNDDNAIDFFNNNKTIFENQKGDASASTSVSLKNYSKYTLIADGKYKCVSRINNTALYLNVDTQYQDEVNEILKEIKY